MWDQPLEEAAKHTLTRTLRDMPQLAHFKVPPIHRINGKQQRPTSHFVRRIKSSNSSISLFTITEAYGNTRIVLLLIKTRMAPLKQQTIPKLELQASVYASRLRRKLNNELTLRIDQTVHWSDSTSVLGGNSNKNKEQHRIANCIYEILEQSRKTE